MEKKIKRSISSNVADVENGCMFTSAIKKIIGQLYAITVTRSANTSFDYFDDSCILSKILKI